jgi:enoyl-[acyl-carrier protein] reductase II
MNGKRISDLFQIKFPIIQAGMVWCSGWKLAAAVSESGGLGIIGSGSMHQDLLREHIRKCKKATNKPFAVNVPLLYPEIDKIMSVILEEGIGIVFTSAGNPALWTGRLKEKGLTVIHVVSSVRFARKSEEAGVDAIVAEGFEAGGHNGREETTTLCLIPMVRDAVKIPLIAAGGIASGRAMLAMEALGAEGVQIGTRFAVSAESSAHENFKQRVISSSEGDTILTLKQLTPVRLLKNTFYELVRQAENRGAGIEELKSILGKGRSKRGILDGDLEEGELEIGQISASVKDCKTASEILHEIWNDYVKAKSMLAN